MASIQNIPPPSPRKQKLRKIKRAPKEAMEWTKKQYNTQYERWMPWVEDQYLKYFTKDNKASYATKDNLAKTKVTGNDGVDKLQDDVHNLAAGQVGQGGLAQPLGDAVSKEGVNRAERGGKDDQGGTAPGPLADVVDPVAEGAKDGGAKAAEGAKAAGGYFGGWFGGKK
ncbi:hypothetical protein GTA08_BOTSDO03590 [Neofusicoccum parvum]|uniref:Uncharacterized protein n=2 Tax=Neofusicoccum parvum TaxID=310453 RepID=R1EN07_BOTPV|nr:hypothetical protein UCRNP2_4094 [Neofusicoccum parvum UCRNP2]GME27969.1 hypothetical protein GTA08_BOTSDO03590 [Neofusicoccum parvum]GME54261.1 hypothetical protein GTA08_BOTSDO03590 [Neofusicoccum parvum]